MQKQDKSDFFALMDDICDLKGIAKKGSGALDLLFGMLHMLTLEQVEEGVARHMTDPKRGQYFPMPADIIAALTGDPERLASEAWEKVLSAMRRAGQYRSVVFDDPRIHTVLVEMGGWVELCNVTMDDLKFREIAFLKRYKSTLGQPIGKYQRVLSGVAEIHNSAHGHVVAEPVLIGNQEQALLVHKRGSDTPKIAHSTMGEALAQIKQQALIGGAA